MRRFVSSQKSPHQLNTHTSINSAASDNFTTLPFPDGAFASPALSFSSTSSLDFPITGSSSPPIAINQQSTKFDFTNSSGSLSSSPSFEFLNAAISSTSSSPASDDSPRSDLFERCTDLTCPLDFTVDKEGCAQLPKLTLDTTLDPFFVDVFTSSPVTTISPEFALWNEGPNVGLSHGAFTYPPSYNYLSNFSSSTSYQYPTFGVSNSSLPTPLSPTPRNVQSTYTTQDPAPAEDAMTCNSQPSVADQQHYRT